MNFGLVRRAYQGAFSTGYGYEPHEAGTRFLVDGIGGYFIDYRPKIPSQAAHPEEPLYPADVAQLALGWWERIVAGELGAADEFMRLCDTLERSGEGRERALLWPYHVGVAKYGGAVPWYSGMAQGQIASVFVRAWTHTGDDRYADLAHRAIEPLLEPGPERLVTRTSDGPVLEEDGPSNPPGHILNGWIFALWGVRDVSIALADVNAGRLVEDTTACLVRKLPQYDVGWWSKYSLYPHPLPDLAKPFYHRLHVTQLDILHELTGLDEFEQRAERWRSFDTPVVAARAVLSKIPFVLADRRARRRRAALDTGS
jgi:heparosan-N-sulfate-glucuronate 5-epimerase